MAVTKPEAVRSARDGVLAVGTTNGLPHWAKLSLAAAVLVVVGGILAPSTVTVGAALSMLPFIAILAVASIGQDLVMQQRGFDLSVAGAMSLAAVLVTTLPPPGTGVLGTLGYAGLTLLAGAVGGAANGIAVALVRIPPLVTTLGINAAMVAVAIWISGGSPHVAPTPLTTLAQGRPLLLPNTAIIMVLVTAAFEFVVRRTTAGRRFVALGASRRAAAATGVPVLAYAVMTFVIAGLCYAVAGLMLAGLLQSPSVTTGAPYVLATVAAVAVGGNVTTDRKASFVATVIGAVVLIYLGELVVSIGFNKAVQYVVQALVIIASVVLPEAARLFAGPRRSAPSAAVDAPAATTAAGASAEVPALELRDIRKSFGPVLALKNVSVAFMPGEVHAIIGENGAGKSTLIAIAAGTVQPNRGAFLDRGQAVALHTAARMRDRGISVVYQHPALAPDLTVLENIRLFLGPAGAGFGKADAERLIQWVALDHLRMPVHRRVGDLSLPQRHIVEIVRALATSPRVLFLDEPTEPFQREDVRQLFEVVRELKSRGVAVVYISHRLHEVLEIADRLSVLRDGELIDTRRRGEISNSEIVTLIAGKPLAQIFPPKPGNRGAPVLEVQGLCGPGFSNVDLVAHRGEIVGLTGVEGQGQRDVLRAIAGVAPRDAGAIRVEGKPIGSGPASARRAGIGFVPDDRHAEGVFLTLSVRENIGFAALPRFATAGLISPETERRITGTAVQDFEVKTPSLETLVANLSGGNQQKVLFGREVLTSPKAILVDEPTRGIDIGTRSEIYRRLREMSDRGVGVVVSSSDGAEVEGLCDRVLIFARGTAVRELTGADVADAAITEANLTVTNVRQADADPARRRTGRRDILTSDHFPAAVLVLISVLIGVGTNVVNPYFLTPFSLGNIMILTAILGFVSVAQLAAVLVGGIDLAVGPLAGLGVVLASFLLTPHESMSALIGGSLLIVALCTAFGLLQGAAVVGLRIPSIVVTLASFIGLQGVSLMLRPAAGGMIDGTLSDDFTRSIAGVPLAMVLTLAAVAVLEVLLYHSGAGRRLRAVGSQETAARKLGVSYGRTILAAFGLSGLLTGVGALMLAAQVGIGSPVTGIDLSLMSITAVVLGGASIGGGRGSFLSTLVGCVLVQLLLSAATFLQAGPAWQYALIGATTLLAAGCFSTVRPRAAA